MEHHWRRQRSGRHTHLQLHQPQWRPASLVPDRRSGKDDPLPVQRLYSISDTAQLYRHDSYPDGSFVQGIAMLPGMSPSHISMDPSPFPVNPVFNAHSRACNTTRPMSNLYFSYRTSRRPSSWRRHLLRTIRPHHCPADCHRKRDGHCLEELALRGWRDFP